MSIDLINPDLYTVGWISVLGIERTAASALLDEWHDEPSNFEQQPADDNSYTWGRMGKHNVVIASFEAGDSGTNSAALLAERMLRSLPHIRVGLLVGIGGGIPSARRDVRLGDVAVSQRKDRSGGVVQYDFVKVTPGQKREGKDFLGKAPGVLLKALGPLQTKHDLGSSKLPKYLEKMLSDYPTLAEPTDERAAFTFPGTDVDRQFKDDYAHRGGDDCQLCDEGQLLPARKQRRANEPKVHYGIIASGNTVVKDAASRKTLIQHLSEDCICYGMEAAGLMNNFPCLVIRGICDYADSHKNDQWQPYAAATAAAFAKELLDYVPQNALQKTAKAIEVIQAVAKDVSEHLFKVEMTTRDTKTRIQNQDIETWLSPPLPSINYNEAKKKRHKDTCQWFIQSETFEEWKTTPSSFIWIHGLVGCGKTILSSAIIDALYEDDHVQRTVLYYFFDYKETAKQSFDGMIRSLIFQLHSASTDVEQPLVKLFSSCQEGIHQPSASSLCATFRDMISSTAKVSIVLDALDECQTRDELLSWMEDITTSKFRTCKLWV